MSSWCWARPGFISSVCVCVCLLDPAGLDSIKCRPMVGGVSYSYLRNPPSSRGGKSLLLTRGEWNVTIELDSLTWIHIIAHTWCLCCLYEQAVEISGFYLLSGKVACCFIRRTHSTVPVFLTWTRCWKPGWSLHSLKGVTVLWPLFLTLT